MFDGILEFKDPESLCSEGNEMLSCQLVLHSLSVTTKLPVTQEYLTFDNSCSFHFGIFLPELRVNYSCKS